jgi:hypothetical protein
VPLVEQELHALPEHLSFKWCSCYPIFSFMCMFCRWLFVLLISIYWIYMENKFTRTLKALWYIMVIVSDVPYNYIKNMYFFTSRNKDLTIMEINLLNLFAPGTAYSMQLFVIKFISNLRQVSGFLWGLRFPSPINTLTCTII